MDILDDEATENDTLVERRPEMANSRPPSHVANAGLIQTAQQYEQTMKAAGESDATVRRKWEEWESRITILADEVSYSIQLYDVSHRRRRVQS